MATAMLTSTPTKEKKKRSSPTKHNRSSVTSTLKRNPNYELKKDELIQLLGRFEGELQAKEIALATLKSEKVKSLLSNARFGRVNGQNDPYAALLRDGEHVKEDVLNEHIPMKTAYETQLAQLEELIVQQRKQVHTLKSALDQTEQRFVLLSEEFDNEKKDKVRLQKFQNQLLIVQEEKIQLKNELNNVKIHNQELEQQLLQVTKLLEHEHERHKKFVVLLLHERKLENDNHQEQLKQLSHHRSSDDTQREARFKELEGENERNKQVLTARVQQLQSEIDAFVKEKKQEQISASPSDGEVGEVAVKPGPKSRPLPSIAPASDSRTPTPSIEPSPPSLSSGAIRRPTVIPAPSSSSKNGSHSALSAAKTSVIPPVVAARTQQPTSMTNSTSSIPELPSSPVPTVAKRNVIPTRSISNVSQSPVVSNNLRSSPSSTGTNVPRSGAPAGGIPRLTKTSHQIVKPTSTGTSTGPAKRTGQTSFSSEHKSDDLRTLIETIQSVAENRLKSPPEPADSPLTNDNAADLDSTSDSSLNSSHSDFILFRAAEHGDTEQLTKFLKLGWNPNCQMIDGNTCLHLSTLHGHIECIRALLKYGANPCLENHLALTPWNHLSKLNETIQIECLHLYVDISQLLPPIDLILEAIEQNHISTYGYLLSISHEQLRENPTDLSRLLRTALRSTNTHFLECLFAVVNTQDFVQFFDSNTFISNECLAVLSALENPENHTKPINLIVRISSTAREHRFSYAIGTLSLTADLSWLDLERSCIKLFTDHITQIDSPFDYVKSSIGCTANSLDTITLGLTKWHYQDSPNDQSPMPYTAAREQTEIVLHLKGIEINATDSLAYNYFIPNQNLKNFVRYIEQNPYVGVYGAAHLQKKSLFEDLMKYLERPGAFSTSSKFKVARFEFESVTSLDDCIDELFEQDFLRTRPWSGEQQPSTKHLLFLANTQNSVGTDVLHLLLNSESISETCQQLCYCREDNPKSTTIYYFPSVFHIFVTMSKRTWSTENDIYKKFKWIPFKIDSVPWNGLLKRHLWRRMIDTNIREKRSVDNELIKTLQWVTNIWQRYNECLQKLSLQDALLGPALFFDCPMDTGSIFEWLQTKWNTVVAPLVRELSMNKCAQPKPKGSSAVAAAAAASAIASSLRANSLEISTPYESVACTALYVLLHRAVSRDCPLTGQEREQYLLNFVGSRLEGGGSASVMSSAASSRAGTPQPSGYCDFVSIQLE